MFSTISLFQLNETPTSLFTNLNVSLFPDETFADDSSSSVSQPTTSLDKSPLSMEHVDSSSVIPSSPSVPPPPILRCSLMSTLMCNLRYFMHSSVYFWLICCFASIQTRNDYRGRTETIWS